MALRLIRRSWLLPVLLGGALGGGVWLASRAPVHREFGPIYTTEMVETLTENWQTGWERGEAMVWRWLRLRQRPPPSQYGLQIGPALLGWSLGGHIYMDAAEPAARNAPRWEFALCARARLAQVTRADLPREFYGVDDPRGTNVFGPPYLGTFTRPAWEGHAIRVAEEQVFFARLATNRATVYVVQLGKWRSFRSASGFNNGRIRAQYVATQSLPGSLSEGSRPKTE